MKTVNICGHTFIPELIKPGGIVLDCGANIGVFSNWISDHLPSTTIYAFEPDPQLFPMMPNKNNLKKHKMAISSVSGSINLWLGDERCSSAQYKEHSKQSQTTVPSTTLESFCSSEKILYVDLIKLDIEGSELSVLSTLPNNLLMQVGQITVEYHDFLDKKDKPHIYECNKRLIRSGFHFLKLSLFNYSDVLFINKNIHNLDISDVINLRIDKYQRGISRFAKRSICKYIT